MFFDILLDKFGYLWTLAIVLVVVGILSSAIIEVIDTLNPAKRKSKERHSNGAVMYLHAWYTIILVCTGTTFLVLAAARELFINPKTNVIDPWDVALAVVVNVVYSALFYHIGGKVVVKKLVKWLGFKKVEEQIGQ